MRIYSDNQRNGIPMNDKSFSPDKHSGDSGAKNIKFENPEDLEMFFHACPDHKAYIDEELYREIKLFNLPIGEKLNVSNAGSGIIRVEWNGK